MQSEAKENNAVFFFDTGQGNDFALDWCEGEDLTGWLIPNNLSDAFEKEFLSNEDLPNKWDEFYRWAEWSMESVVGDPKMIKIKFTQY